MFWEFVKSTLFFRMFYFVAGLSFLYFYVKNLELFQFVDSGNETKELNSKISCIERIEGCTKAIHVPNENNDRLEKECNSLQQKNYYLSNIAISSVSERKAYLESRMSELIAKNTELLEKVDEARKVNNELKEEKQDWEEEIKFIKADIDELKDENEALAQKVK